MDRISTRDARGATVGVKGIAIEVVVATVEVAVGTKVEVSVGNGEGDASTCATVEVLQASSANSRIHRPIKYFDLNSAPLFQLILPNQIKVLRCSRNNGEHRFEEIV
jgi:hypothetical protein